MDLAYQLKPDFPNTKVFENVRAYNNADKIVEENVIYTWFRPSAPKWQVEPTWFHLGHMLQVKNVSDIVKTVWWKVFFIIANMQWFSDLASKNHSNNMKVLTDNYKTEILSTIYAVGLNDMVTPVVFLESDIRRSASALTDLIHNHIYEEDFRNYLWWEGNFFEREFSRQKIKGFLPSISNVIICKTWQVSRIIWAWATIVPSWLDDIRKTEIANIVIKRINGEYWLLLPQITAIWSVNMLTGVDGRVMSTNYWNCISMWDWEEYIIQKINKLWDNQLLEYATLFDLVDKWVFYSSKEMKDIVLNFILEVWKKFKYFKENNWNDKKLLDTMLKNWAESYNESINRVEKEIAHWMWL